MTGLAQATMDSSFVLVYYNPSNEAATAWYPVPGLGSTANYETRYYAYQSATDPSEYTFSVRTHDPATGLPYGSPVTFTRLRIFVVPATSVIGASLVASKTDLMDYSEVAAQLDIRD